jgi:hypothetical protein
MSVQQGCGVPSPITDDECSDTACGAWVCVAYALLRLGPPAPWQGQACGQSTAGCSLQNAKQITILWAQGVCMPVVLDGAVCSNRGGTHGLVPRRRFANVLRDGAGVLKLWGLASCPVCACVTVWHLYIILFLLVCFGNGGCRGYPGRVEACC